MALEIPLCPDDGIWIDDLERALDEHNVRACVFSSSVSNPMGSFMDDEKRQTVVEILEHREVPFIEDDVYGDLYFTAQRGTPASLYSKKGLC